MGAGGEDETAHPEAAQAVPQAAAPDTFDKEIDLIDILRRAGEVPAQPGDTDALTQDALTLARHVLEPRNRWSTGASAQVLAQAVERLTQERAEIERELEEVSAENDRNIEALAGPVSAQLKAAQESVERLKAEKHSLAGQTMKVVARGLEMQRERDAAQSRLQKIVETARELQRWFVPGVDYLTHNQTQALINVAAALDAAAPEPTAKWYAFSDWLKEQTMCVVCPGCGFTFSTEHVDDGTMDYTCPVCGATSAQSGEPTESADD